MNFRATGDMELANTLTLSQKAAGALTVTLDVDQTTNPAGDDVAQMAVAATNATSVSVVFDSDYLAAAGAAAGETAATDNISTIDLTTTAATTVSVVSGGANAQNVLDLTDLGTSGGKVTSVTVSGSQSLALTTTTTGNLSSVNSSASTGGITVSTDVLSNGGTITLGSGVDVVTLGAGSTAVAGQFETVAGFEKSTGTSAAAVADADKLDLAGAVAADGAVGTSGTVADGKLTFSGAGPATLTDAFAIAAAAGGVTAFEYIGNTFVYDGGGAVRLAGVTGVTALELDAVTGDFFIV